MKKPLAIVITALLLLIVSVTVNAAEVEATPAFPICNDDGLVISYYIKVSYDTKDENKKIRWMYFDNSYSGVMELGGDGHKQSFFVENDQPMWNYSEAYDGNLVDYLKSQQGTHSWGLWVHDRNKDLPEDDDNAELVEGTFEMPLMGETLSPLQQLASRFMQIAADLDRAYKWFQEPELSYVWSQWYGD